MTTDLIPRATLEALLAHRERTFTLATEARAMHRATLAKVKEAQQAAMLAVPGDYTLHKLLDHLLDRHDDDEKFMANVRKDMDRAIWPYVLGLTGLKGMMDKQARDEFNRDLASEPPECTADNIRATFRQLRDNARIIFRRGVVNVFRNLSREYRSHDGFKLGPRTIISRGVGDYRDYHTFADADRIMHILDGKRVGEGWYSTLAERLNREVKTTYSDGRGGFHRDSIAVPGELTTPYWRVKWFQNKNAHLWCLRPDLLRRANRLIAEHYENQVGEGPDAAGARRHTRAKPHHHEVEDFYATRPAAVERACDAADLRPGLNVLEPQAGEGAIVRGILARGLTPDAVEIDEDRADTLRDLLPPGAVVCMDFLRMHPEPEYDRVICNPPWGKGAGVQHVHHALRFLKPGGRLVAILGPGFDRREDGPTVELRRLMKAWGGKTERLPAGSFEGTATDGILLTLDKPGLTAAAPAAQAALLLGDAA